jgi:hypothetical protein
MCESSGDGPEEGELRKSRFSEEQVGLAAFRRQSPRL